MTWTKADSDRRCELIEQDVLGNITPADYWELRTLTNRLHRHNAGVAPLPIREVTSPEPGETERECFEAEAAEYGWSLVRSGEGYYGRSPDVGWLMWKTRASLDRGTMPKLVTVPEFPVVKTTGRETATQSHPRAERQTDPAEPA